MYYGQVVLCDACSVEVWGSNACGGSYKENRGKAGLELSYAVHEEPPGSVGSPCLWSVQPPRRRGPNQTSQRSAVGSVKELRYRP